jgi:hypothetical protein
VLFQLFEGLLDGTLSGEFVRDTRYSIALVLVAGAVAMQYWLVLREDQQAAEPSAVPAVATRRRDVIAVVPRGAEGVLREIGGLDGVRLRSWRRLDAPATSTPWSAEQVATLRETLAAAEGDRFLLILGDGRFELVPYETT